MTSRTLLQKVVRRCMDRFRSDTAARNNTSLDDIVLVVINDMSDEETVELFVSLLGRQFPRPIDNGLDGASYVEEITRTTCMHVVLECCEDRLTEADQAEDTRRERERYDG